MLAPCQPLGGSRVSAAPVLESADDVPRTGIEAARRWAVELGLRPGHTWSVRPGALVPLVAQWCAARGWPPVDVGAIGRGLSAAGLETRERPTDPKRLLLHRDDAARLRPLVWEAWAPRVPPGERPKKREQRLPLQCALARLNYLKPTPPGFHAQLTLEGGNARPVVDSRGRVYPSLAYAARHMVGKREKKQAPGLLGLAMRKDGHWRGLVWRYLLPQEFELIPREALCGARVEDLNWHAVSRNHALLTGAHLSTVLNQCSSRDDEREG
jgi:hypothetical protein